MRNNLKTWKIFVNRADLIQASHWVAVSEVFKPEKGLI